MEAISVQTCANFLTNRLLREGNLNQILGAIYRAIADLELSLPAEAQEDFGAGEVYDFFNALNKVVRSAEVSIFVIDPYLDESVFDHYLVSRNDEVKVRLLSGKGAERLVPAKEKYNAQHGEVLELRKSKAIHDRVIFVDNYVCWMLGQSVKDAAKAKPTYLVQSSPDTVAQKLGFYESIWGEAITL